MGGDTSDESGRLEGMLTSSSKKVLILLGVGFRLDDEAIKVRPCIEAGAMTVRVIWEGVNI